MPPGPGDADVGCWLLLYRMTQGTALALYSEKQLICLRPGPLLGVRGGSCVRRLVGRLRPAGLSGEEPPSVPVTVSPCGAVPAEGEGGCGSARRPYRYSICALPIVALKSPPPWLPADWWRELRPRTGGPSPCRTGGFIDVPRANARLPHPENRRWPGRNKVRQAA